MLVASVNRTDRRQALAVCLPICRQAENIGAWSLSLCHACPNARWSRRGAQAFEAGLDPSIKRKLDKQAAGNTFRVVAEELLKKPEREGRAPTTLVKLRWLLDFAFAAFGERPIAEITAPEILLVLRRIEAGEPTPCRHRKPLDDIGCRGPRPPRHILGRLHDIL